MDDNMATKPHHGRNIRRLREIRGLKQEALGIELTKNLGEVWNQGRVSYLEGRETIEADLLEEVAKILQFPIEVIRDFPDPLLPAFFSPIFKGSSATGWFGNFSTFNLNGQVAELYERLISEKVEFMKREQELLIKEIELLKKENELLRKKDQ